MEEIFGGEPELDENGNPIAGGLNAEEAKKAVEFYNEQVREKAVFEDFGFDETDADELATRDA